MKQHHKVDHITSPIQLSIDHTLDYSLYIIDYHFF